MENFNEKNEAAEETWKEAEEKATKEAGDAQNEVAPDGETEDDIAQVHAQDEVAADVQVDLARGAQTEVASDTQTEDEAAQADAQDEAAPGAQGRLASISSSAKAVTENAGEEAKTQVDYQERVQKGNGSTSRGSSFDMSVCRYDCTSQFFNDHSSEQYMHRYATLYVYIPYAKRLLGFAEARPVNLSLRPANSLCAQIQNPNIT
jgi:hypothetical protein